ncbi:MAG: hypothetical protein AAFP26_13615 [Planctomycetota bacterium]
MVSGTSVAVHGHHHHHLAPKADGPKEQGDREEELTIESAIRRINRVKSSHVTDSSDMKLAELLQRLHTAEWDMMGDLDDLVLDTLDLDGLDLTRVPAAVRELEYYAFRRVQAVSVNSNARLRDAARLGELEDLEAVNAWGADLTGIPRSWCRLRRLTFLGLGANRRLRGFSVLSDLAARLQSLDLGACGLARLPDEVYELTRLKSLALGHNPGIELDAGRLAKGLRRLALNACELSRVPDGVYELSGLRRLHLDDNDLDALGQDVLKLRDLRELTLTGNPRLVALPKLLTRMERVALIAVDGDTFDIGAASHSLRHKIASRPRRRAKVDPSLFGDD